MKVKQVFAHYDQTGQSSAGFKHCPLCGTHLSLVKSGHKQRPTCPDCGFVQYQNPAPTISILIIDQGRVLLGKRRGHPGRGTWALPSGYIEYEDNFITAAIREAKEETGLDIEILSILNVVSSFVSPRFHFLGVYLVARILGGNLVVHGGVAFSKQNRKYDAYAVNTLGSLLVYEGAWADQEHPSDDAKLVFRWRDPGAALRHPDRALRRGAGSVGKRTCSVGQFQGLVGDR
ncbi:MAG: NUDIX hydrolase [Anaerolineae bacterium]|nr:NUDIX hydrolase [Anaerolineae bacterium]